MKSGPKYTTGKSTAGFESLEVAASDQFSPSALAPVSVIERKVPDKSSGFLCDATEPNACYSHRNVSDTDEPALSTGLKNLSHELASFESLPIPNGVLASAKHLSLLLRDRSITTADVSPTQDQSILFAIEQQDVEYHVEIFSQEEFAVMKTGHQGMHLLDFNSLEDFIEFIEQDRLSQ